MRKYSDYMDEIGADELYKALLAYGMFPESLPPFLSSEEFYDYCQLTLHVFSDKPRKYIYYENMRNINIPRPLGIPSPMAYQKLCKCLRDNWEEIQNYFRDVTKNQEYKVSRIHIRKMSKKNYIFEMNYSNWKSDSTPELDLLIDNYYIVNADISKCFPSIYTHSIPWALVGKHMAKTSRKTGWYNDIDHYVQNTKHGETHGILIGPHVSNILSEIILSAIDYKLINKGWKYMRYVDDYTCYVRTEQEARQFLIDLQAELREFDLTLNHKKTQINTLPSAAVEQWVRKINSISVITSYGKVDYKNCRAYLDFAIEIAKSEGENSSVLKYAIKVLGGQSLTVNAKVYMQKTVFHLCLIYPYLIPLLDEYIFTFCNTSIQDIRLISDKLYDIGIHCRTFEAGCYSLYFAVKYDFRLSSINVLDIIGSKDCIFMLLAHIYFSSIKDKTSCKQLKNFAISLAADEDEFNQYWLFVYEVLPQSYLKDDWKSLKKAKVSFVKKTW